MGYFRMQSRSALQTRSSLPSNSAATAVNYSNRIIGRAAERDILTSMDDGAEGERKRWLFLSERSLAGLAVTLGAITIFSLYALRQIAALKDFQASTVDRNRRDSLQLLRIQNNLHSLGLAMRDMLSGDEPYPLDAWQTQFTRIRSDLDDALRLEARLAPALRSPYVQEHLRVSLTQFWASADQAFEPLAPKASRARA